VETPATQATIAFAKKALIQVPYPGVLKRFSRLQNSSTSLPGSIKTSAKITKVLTLTLQYGPNVNSVKRTLKCWLMHKQFVHLTFGTTLRLLEGKIVSFIS